MPAGEAFTQRQRDEILRSIRIAEDGSGLRMSVYVGELGGDARRRAEDLHAEFGPMSPQTVLVAVDPAMRQLEVVTGTQARYRLDDRSCSLAGISMTTAFAGGDLSGGIATGVRMLGDHAGTSPGTAHLS